MISMMDMTTGEWESECSAPDIRLAADGFIPRMDASPPNPPLLAGLCEYAAPPPLRAEMPVEVAALDLDDFLARMNGPAR